jgi:hypothetical protein
LAFQLGNVDVDAALLGDRVDRSREIGVAQQFLVAYFADRRPGELRQESGMTIGPPTPILAVFFDLRTLGHEM